MYRKLLKLALCLFAIIFFTSAPALDIYIDSDAGGELEDAILITSSNGACPHHAIALGDLDLAKRQHIFDLSLDPTFTHWWIIGHMGPEIVYSSNLNLHGADFYSNEPFDDSWAESVLPAPVIISSLAEYMARRVQFRFGVMADTHYYSEPLGIPHPNQQIEPALDLKGNLDRMQIALNDSAENNAAFAVLLGDMVEDHAAWPLSESFIANGALSLNLLDIGNLFDQYSFPIHLVLGNHDKSHGTSRSDLYNHLSYYWQESYDNNDYANRMDYIFDFANVRFIVYDNVGRLPGANTGYRSASYDTLAFLANELGKVQTGGVDEGKPVIILAHARVDCLVSDGCNQKSDLTDGVKYQWTLSAGGTNEYFLEADGGGDPQLELASFGGLSVWLNGTGIPLKTIGSLDLGEWGYGGNSADPINFDTVYIRLSDPLEEGSWDPDNAAPRYVEYKSVNQGASENF